MKTIKFFMVVVIVFQSASNIFAQKTFIYDESGKKHYLFETNKKVVSLYQVNDTNISFDIWKDVSYLDKNAILLTNNMLIAEVEDKQLNTITEKYGSLFEYTPLLLTDDGEMYWTTNQIIIKRKPGNNVKELLRNINVEYTSIEQLGSDSLVSLIELPDNTNVIEVSNLLFENGNVEFAQPNWAMYVDAPNNPLFDYQWNLFDINNGYDINVVNAWSISSGENIKVAVLDEGVELTHPDLINNIIIGYDATEGETIGTNGGNKPNDNHGTGCAGIIAATDNNIGLKGIAYNSKILPVRIAYKNPNNNKWVSKTSWKVKGISYAWDTARVDVLSNSWTYSSGYNSSVNNEIEKAATYGRNGLGCVVIFSTGNNDSNGIKSPSNLNSVIAVGAISYCGLRKSPYSCDDGENWGSNYGTGLSVVAPGVRIPTTALNGGYTVSFNGTSAACPHVAGIAALILSKKPLLTGPQVKSIIELTARKIHDNDPYYYSNHYLHPHGRWNLQMGYGLVDAYQALLMADVLYPSADIYMRDNPNDIGSEPNISTSVWSNTPDIWITDMNGNVVTSPKCGKKYWVHYLVTNKNNIPSNNTTLNLRWAIASSAPTWRNNWYSAGTLCGKPKCGTIASSINLGNIPAYGTKEDSVLWTAPLFESMTCLAMPGKTWNLAICGVLDDGNLTSGLNNTNLSMDVFTSQNNNVVWKNFSLINAIDEVYMAIAEDPFLGGHHFDFLFVPSNSKDGELLSQHINIYIKLSDEFFEAWQKGGMKGEGIEIMDEHTIKINTPKARLGNIFFENEVDYPFAIYVDYTSYAMLDAPVEWKMTQLCYETDEVDSVVSSTVLYIDLNEPKRIDVRANENTMALAGDIVGFTAESGEVDAVFIWYNTVGDTIGIDDAVSITSTVSQQIYLEGYSPSVGAYGYDTVTVTVRRAAITALTPNPANNQTVVSYRLASDVTSASIVIANATGQVLYSAPLDVTQTAHTVNLQAIPTGQYTVRIESQGSPLDSKTLIVY